MASNVSTTSNPATDSPSWQHTKTQFRVGQIVEGVVTEVRLYGVFFDVGAEFPAFLDVLEVPSEGFDVGDEAWLKIGQFADWNQQIRVTLADDREATAAMVKQNSAGASARLEGEYLKFKAAYDTLSVEEQSQLRDVVGLLIQAEQQLRDPALSNFRVRLGHGEASHRESGEIADSERTFVPTTALQAIDAWSRGEKFLPKPAFRIRSVKSPEDQSQFTE